MIAYGSYVSDDANLGKSINQIEIFDTLVAFLAGVMIIPAVFVFMGRDGMTTSGPSLMFVSLPKVFDSMGFAGNVIGAIFFAMVFFAALTSAVSIMEGIVSSFIGWILKPKTVIDEVEKTGIKMGRKWLYTVMVKWVAPILLFLLLLKSLGILTII